MYEKSITYTNLDGETVTETFYFHLTEAEAVELNFTREGGIEAYAKKIIAAKSHAELIDLFKGIIQMAYGVRDGQRFRKNEEVLAEFVETGAYSELFIQLATNTDEAIRFFRGIMPEKLKKRFDESVSTGDREYTDEELLTMSWDEFYKAAGGTDDKEWDKRFLLLGFRRKSANAA